MLDKCQPSQYEQPKWMPRGHPVLDEAIQKEIGRGLRGEYEISTKLPDQMLTLLKQLTEQDRQD